MYIVDCKKKNCPLESLFALDGWVVIARQAFWLMLSPVADSMPYQQLAYVDSDLLRTLSDKLLFWLPSKVSFLPVPGFIVGTVELFACWYSYLFKKLGREVSSASVR